MKVPPVLIYDGGPLLAAMGRVRTDTPTGPEFQRRAEAAYREARLPRMDGGAVAADDAARAARTASSSFLSRLEKTFGRSGWDDEGSPLRIAVHVPSPWEGPSNDNFDAYAGVDLVGTDRERVPVAVIHGVEHDGRRITAAESEGVLAHEIMHMVWEDEVGSTTTERPWRTALNEAWADAIPFAFDDDWIMGETPGYLPTGFRDLRHPTYRTLDEIPSREEFESDSESWEHAAADTLNQPMVAFAERYGRPAMGQVWYKALVDEMDPRRIGVADAARATMRAAALRFGPAHDAVAFLRARWREIGVEV